MKQVQISLYSFNELSKEAREKAISEHGIFLDNEPEQFENDNGEMQEEYVDHAREQIIESIQVNDYLFYSDGQIAHCCTFTGGHEKAGTTEFYFHGKTFIVNK